MLRNKQLAYILFVIAVIANFCGSLSITTAVHQHSHASLSHRHTHVGGVNSQHTHSHDHPHTHENCLSESPYAAYRRSKNGGGNGAGQVGKSDDHGEGGKVEEGHESIPHVHIVIFGLELSLALPGRTDVPQWLDSSEAFCESKNLDNKGSLASWSRFKETIIGAYDNGNILGKIPWMMVVTSICYRTIELSTFSVPCVGTHSLSQCAEPATPPPRYCGLLQRV